MAYDPINNIITIQKGVSFSGDSACKFVLMLKTFALRSASPGQVADWVILERWLGCQGRELNQSDFKSISRAYVAYSRYGNSTILEREIAFSEGERDIEVKSSDLPPQEVQDVFRRLSTPKEDDSNSIKNDGQPKPSAVNTKEYPKAFIHLRTQKGRAFWSLVLLMLTNVAIFLERGLDGFLWKINRDLDEYVIAMLGVTFFSFLILTGLHVVIKKVYLDWGNSREVRLWTFGSICWIASIFIFVLLFDPYNLGSFGYIDDDELVHMFSVMFVPPAFLIVVRWWYVRQIR